MSYSSGDSFGYDQIQPNMMLDNYDSPYAYVARNPNDPMDCKNAQPYRAFLAPSGPRWVDSEGAALAANARVSEPKMSKPCPRVPQETDAAIGLVRHMDGFVSRARLSVADTNFILLLFIVIMTMAMISNSITMRHLKKQIKLLTKQAIASAS
jgi:hypothetical protein